MATIIEIKAQNDTYIRQKTLPSTITKSNDSMLRDTVAEEIRVRGVIQAASTGELDDHSHLNTTLILVHNDGFFIADETPDAADNVTTFESADAGWLWRKIVDVSAASGKDTFTLTGNGTYILAEDFMIDLITIKPSTTQTQKAGTTLAGDEIMLEQELPANVTKAVQVVIIAEGGTVTLYFTGITASTVFTIYKRQL